MVSTGIDVKNHFLISTNSIVLAFKVSYIFQVAGIAMMLAISLLRYRATLKTCQHPTLLINLVSSERSDWHEHWVRLTHLC